MASLDLRDAYYSVPVSKEHRKYLKFRLRGCLYHYNCLPNGLSSAPRFFTKLLKPALSHMRSQNYVSSIYLDDLYLQGDSYEECEQNLTFTVNMLSQLGFVIHQEKSNFIPKQVINHLRFRLNSLDMCVSLTRERQEKVVDMCKKLLDAKELKIVEIDRLSGTLVSCMLGIEYGLMHYRHIEIQKTKSLQSSKGNYNGIVTELTREARVKLLVASVHNLRVLLIFFDFILFVS